jgi:predicted DNA-binding transcriptional regulator AlpA
MRVIPRNRLSEKGIPFSDEWIRQLVAAGKFPKPVKIGNRVAFVEDEVDAWLRDRAAARDQVVSP